MRTLSVLLSCLLLVPLPALAQDEAATPGVGTVTEESNEFAGTLDGGIGWAQLGEDHFLDVAFGFAFSISKLAVGLLVPLRFRLIDESPEDDSVIRGEDWDEASDWLRVLNFVQWGSRQDTVYARGGELVAVMLGHGTIVNGYHNVVDINHFQWGINGAVNLAFGGLELLLDNLVDPEIMGLRTYVRPWTFVDPESFWTRLAFGISLVGDIDAPERLATDELGLFVFDDEENFVVEQSAATGVLGFDAEMQVFTNDLVSVTPYTDVNFHLGHGSGFHLGSLTNFSFSDDFALNTRLEFRALGDGYEPDYFDGLYEVERFLFRSLDVTDQRRPKLQVLQLDPPESRVGFYGETTFGLYDLAFLTLGLEDYQGERDTGFLARLSLTEAGPVSVGAYFVNQNLDNLGEVFDLENALLVAEARAFVSGPFYVIAQYARRWSSQEDGTYKPNDDWGVGFGVSFPL